MFPNVVILAHLIHLGVVASNINWETLPSQRPISDQSSASPVLNGFGNKSKTLVSVVALVVFDIT